MKILMLASAMGAAALTFGAGAANATMVNFDEFTSPPVTCCFGNPIAGAIVYPSVTIDGGAQANVMNGDGWSNQQTSGANLYGTTGGSMSFLFNSDASGLNFDLINGVFAAFTFTVHLYNAANVEIGTHSVELGNFTTPQGVGHLGFAEGGIRTLLIDGNSDFAVDTIGFDAAPGVPEPASWALMIGGFGLAGAALRRRRSVAATA